ncbi:hypothetical protein K402DRAFT_459392 [Aulographum hederae CBS 113979]|uniref:Uncharacterized protein n=1 Tax=Aulographum hederae CBS 113979 TaxID=1176131 RepID=A0A6G1HDW7_9PEZI|nr:hypothetical protein K402DRAFT_459392 [Aulographum hederae CBS 113979]
MVECLHEPAVAPADPDIIGIGVAWSFLTTAALTFLTCLIVMIIRLCRKNEQPGGFWPTTLRAVLISLYDQQLVTGMAIQIVCLAKLHFMIQYHLIAIWMLGGITTMAQFAALIVCFRDLSQNKYLSWLRQLAMFINCALNCVLGAFVASCFGKDLDRRLPVSCSLFPDGPTHKSVKPVRETARYPYVVAALVIVILAQVLLLSFAVRALNTAKSDPTPDDTRRRRRHIVYRWVGVVVALLLFIALALILRFTTAAFGRITDVSLEDHGSSEREWSFGQIIPMVLLVFPFITLIETWLEYCTSDDQTINGQVDSMELDEVVARYHQIPKPSQEALV